MKTPRAGRNGKGFVGRGLTPRRSVRVSQVSIGLRFPWSPVTYPLDIRIIRLSRDPGEINELNGLLRPIDPPFMDFRMAIGKRKSASAAVIARR